MSKTQNGIKVNMIQENTTLNPYTLAIMWTNADEVVAGTSTSAPFVGITDESADGVAGNPVWIVLTGTAKLIIASDSTKGAYITWTTAGAWLATTTDTNEVIWVLLETTTVSWQVAEVALRQGRFVG